MTVKIFVRTHLILVMGALLAVPAWVKAGEDACKKFARPSSHFIYVVDSSYRKIPGPDLPLGDIDLFHGTNVEGRFFVVSSSDLIADASLPNRDVAGIPRPIESGCPRIHLSSLDYSFDSSPLPPGNFSIDYPVFGRNSEGQPILAASIKRVTGRVIRVWIKAVIDKPGVLRLINAGNMDSPSFSFDRNADADSGVRIVRNGCEGKPLRISESCTIDFEADHSALQSDSAHTWFIGFANSESFTRLDFSLSNGVMAVYTANK